MNEQRTGLGQRIPAKPAKRHVVTDDYDLEEEDEYYVTRPHTSARRYDRLPVQEQVFQQGNRTYHVRHGSPPVPPRRQQYFEEEEEQPKPRRKVHKLLYVGIALFVIVAFWQGLNGLGYWWQQK